jgi:tetratricopeptide (TPR) repeat protein
MGRIKLPGKEKNKKVLLLVLVIIVLGILCREEIIKMNSVNTKKKQQEEIMKPSNIEDDSNTKNEDEESINSDTSKLKNDDNGDENNNSSKENKLYNEAYALFFSHEYNNAINKAQNLINEFPRSSKGYNIRGIARAYNGDYNGAMSDINQALTIDNNYGYARFNKALTYELFGKMDEALEWYNKDLEVENYEWSYYGMASIYGRKGDVKNTVTYLNKAIQIDSGVKEVAKTEHDFDPVKNSDEFRNAVYN